MLFKLDFWAFILYGMPPLQNLLQQELLVGFSRVHFQPLSLLPASIPCKLTTHSPPRPPWSQMWYHNKTLANERWTRICCGYSGEMCVFPIKGIDTLPATSLPFFLLWIWSRCWETGQPSWKCTDQKNDHNAAYLQEDFLLHKKIHFYLMKPLVSVTRSWAYS